MDLIEPPEGARAGQVDNQSTVQRVDYEAPVYVH